MASPTVASTLLLCTLLALAAIAAPATAVASGPPNAICGKLVDGPSFEICAGTGCTGTYELGRCSGVSVQDLK